MQNNRISNEGADFLKTATAAPDFQSAAAAIPDGAAERSFVLHSFLQVPITVDPGSTFVILVPPTGCISHYSGKYNTNSGFPGGFAMDNTPFVESKQVFPEWFTNGKAQNTDSVDLGRVVSHSSELVSVNNSFTQYGTILSYKTPMNLKEDSLTTSGGSPIWTINGVIPLTQEAATTASYLEPVRAGCYSVGMCRTGGANLFPFRDVIDRVNYATKIPGFYQSPAALQNITFLGAPPLWDQSFDTIVYKITVPDNDMSSGVVAQQLILKVWRTIEYSPVYNSLLYAISSQGPVRNEPAMRLYAEIERNLPVAVPAKDNPDFWESVLDTVSSVSSVASLLPGIGGVVGKGVHALTGALKPKKQASSVTSRQTAPPPKPPKVMKKMIKKKKGKGH